jgi:hypothetical protein
MEEAGLAVKHRPLRIQRNHEETNMFGSDTKVKLARPLYERLAAIARTGGYSSTEEFIVHILEKEAAKFDGAADDEEVRKQLRGLGYIE